MEEKTFAALPDEPVELSAGTSRTLVVEHDPFDMGPAPAPARERYELLGTLGRGGMGLVHLARDKDLLRKVALKQLGPEVAHNEEALARFVKEVQITAQLDHPHIVPVYGLEAGGGSLGYAMKLVQGRTFADLAGEARSALEKGRALGSALELPARLEHFLKACDAVAYAHAKGVLHRDLKPANLMVGRWNEVYVMDWGLARLIGRPAEAAVELAPIAEGDSGAAETQLGTVVGTPRYMSPEQLTARSDTLDGRSDEYALGLILFELVTLGPAVPGKTMTEVASAVAEGRKNPMVPAVPGAEVPRGLVAIVEKATAYRREDRYGGVAELAADVRRWLHDEEIAAAPDRPLQRAMRWTAHHRRATLGALGGLLLLSVAVLLFGLWRRQVQEERARLREARLERFLADVSRNAETIDAHLLQLQGLLQGLAGAAEHALTSGTPSREPFATIGDFRDPRRRPGDAFLSTRYHGWASATDPVWVVPPGPRALDEVRRLVPLRRMRRHLFIESQGRASDRESAVPSKELLDSAELPLVWTLVGLEDGVGSIYPGSDRVRDGWDPRERPWYRQAVDARGPVWGAPHQDALGTGLVLSFSVPLHDAAGALLGVAAADLSFDRIAHGLLALPGYPAVEECFLVDDEGEILVRSRPSAAPALDASGAVKLERFPWSLPEMTSGAGFATVWSGGRAKRVVWSELQARQIAYVVVADQERLTQSAP